ncbi:MAG: RNA polymerase sigma factor [Armatimonadota bacterium]
MEGSTALMASPQLEDDLVRRVRCGDGEAFGRLVELCSPRVYNLAYRLIGNQDDAQDIAQEAFVRIFQSLPGFKGESAFSTWLYRIVTNLCYDELKRRRRRPPTISEYEREASDDSSSTLEAVSGENTEDRALRDERQHAVRQAIAQLPEQYRMILVLYDLQGFSYDEISGILKTNLGTVKSRLNRARNLLRQKLSDQRELFDLANSQSE